MKTLLKDIRELILSSRRAVVHSVDLIHVFTNFKIGRHVVEHEQEGAERARYGETVLKDLAASLTSEFGKGFSLTNLKLMRQFYLTYRQQIGQTSSGVLQSLRKSQTLSDQSAKIPIPSGEPALLAKMQMYVNYFDRFVKLAEERPTVGIILCKKKHDALVEITLPRDANVHARVYHLYILDKEELRRKLIEWSAEMEQSVGGGGE